MIMSRNWIHCVVLSSLAMSMPIAFGQQSEPKLNTGVAKPLVVPAQGAVGIEAGRAAEGDLELTSEESEVLASTRKLMDAFNRAEVSEVVEMFLADGELIDEGGQVHLGHEEIGNLLKAFYERFPGVTTEAVIESIRMVGGLALVDGTRLLTGSDGNEGSVIRFATIWKKTDKGFKVLSLRDVSEPTPPSPHDALQDIAWLVGSWVNEGSTGKVDMTYRWSDDENFLLGDILVFSVDGTQIMKSTQRIAWDAHEGGYRSWTFDSDGGFGEGTWSATEAGWTLISHSLSPTGQRGSGLMKITAESKDRFHVTATYRMTSGIEEPVYEYSVVRRPPEVK